MQVLTLCVEEVADGVSSHRRSRVRCRQLEQQQAAQKKHAEQQRWAAQQRHFNTTRCCRPIRNYPRGLHTACVTQCHKLSLVMNKIVIFPQQFIFQMSVTLATKLKYQMLLVYQINIKVENQPNLKFSANSNAKFRCLSSSSDRDRSCTFYHFK